MTELASAKFSNHCSLRHSSWLLDLEHPARPTDKQAALGFSCLLAFPSLFPNAGDRAGRGTLTLVGAKRVALFESAGDIAVFQAATFSPAAAGQARPPVQLSVQALTEFVVATSAFPALLRTIRRAIARLGSHAHFSRAHKTSPYEKSPSETARGHVFPSDAYPGRKP